VEVSPLTNDTEQFLLEDEFALLVLAGSRFYDKNGIAFSEHVCFLRLISVALFFFLFLSAYEWKSLH
jgi:hypothetical protein